VKTDLVICGVYIIFVAYYYLGYMANVTYALFEGVYTFLVGVYIYTPNMLVAKCIMPSIPCSYPRINRTYTPPQI
jgi:sugar phosphate permease